MRLLLLQDEGDEVRDRLRFGVESAFGAVLDHARTVDETAQALNVPERRPDLVVFDLQRGSPEDLRRVLVASEPVPVLLCVSEQKGEEHLLGPNVVGIVDRAKLLESLVAVVETLIEKGTVPKPVLDDRYCRIRSRLLLAVSPLKGDIYIRLSEWKFVRLFQEGDVFDKGDLERYAIKKGVEFLYIRSDQTKEFIEKYGIELKKLLGGAHLSFEAASRSAETAHEAIQELGKRIGFTREVQELAKTQVQISMKSVGRSPRLMSIIARMKNAKGDYIASHSMMCAYIACSIASLNEWGSDMTFFKLNLAAFLHDISLQNPEVAACDGLADLERSAGKFTAEEIADFRGHPVKGAEIARQFTEVPPDVDTIILQHHEKPDGSGFPRGLAQSYIAPLTVVFILAHDLTEAILARGPYFDMTEFLMTERKKYASAQFKKVLASMENL